MAKQSTGSVGSDSGDSAGDNSAASAIGAIDTAAIAEPEPPKRGGWPKGKPRGSAGSRDTGSGTGSTGTTGRTAGTSRAQEKATQLDLSGISQALMGIHMGIAMMSKHQHRALEPQEADAIAESVKNVARHYPAVAKSQKLVDWVMLIQTVGFMYVPRAMMSKELAGKPKQQRTNGDGTMASPIQM